MNISRRLDKLIQTAVCCTVLADIGCDHGYVGISALKSGKADRVIAADVAEGPLSAARINAAAEGVSDRMDFVLSDGFKAISSGAGIQCAVIAGMGGILMRDILKNGGLGRFKELRQLVLSPQSDIDLVRRYIIEELRGQIACEHVLYDEGKYYFIFDVRLNDRSGSDGNIPEDVLADAELSENAAYAAGTLNASAVKQHSPAGSVHEAYTEAEYYYGRNISADSTDSYIDYLLFRQRVSESARAAAAAGSSDKGRAKTAELDKQLEYIQTMLSRYVLN